MNSNQPNTILNLGLPPPWPNGNIFPFNLALQINWIVGPNGSGKSRFLRTLRDSSRGKVNQPRLLTTDRLAFVRQPSGFQHVFGLPRTANGVDKSLFRNFLGDDESIGSITGTLCLLYERPAIRVRVEAALSQLLRRHIKLEMVDGRLQPNVRFGTLANYGMFQNECHGVLELIVLLGNIYDQDQDFLLIDEPELNLHPQYQAFIFQEIRRAKNKRFVLATHSPYFLNVDTLQELEGVICFHGDYRMPTRYTNGSGQESEILGLISRMTDQHRSFFFATQPVFTEGPSDANLFIAIQKALHRSVEAAGSSILPSGGKDNCARFLMLCQALQKDAHFVFDLDAMFDQRLVAGAKMNSKFIEGVAAAGHGEFQKHIGQLQQEIGKLLSYLKSENPLPTWMHPLLGYLNKNTDLNKQRVALLVSLGMHEAQWIDSSFKTAVLCIQGLLNSACEMFRSINVHVLRKGALENYLPSYAGPQFELNDTSKATAVEVELDWLAQPHSAEEIQSRYGKLMSIIEVLPSAPIVDVIPILRHEIADVLHALILNIRKGEVQNANSVPNVLGEIWKRVNGFLSLRTLEIKDANLFEGEILLADKFGIGEIVCRFDNMTQSNNPHSLRLESLRK